MKVSVWYNNEDIRIEEVPRPKPGDKEMLIKVISCGICGSDIVEWYRQPRAPLVQGHEIGAEVVEVGRAVSAYKPGDRVFVAPKVPCMQCAYCKNGQYPVCSNVKERLPGGFAEYVLVPQVLVENGIYRLPDSISYDQSTFIEPLACVVRAQQLAGVRNNQTVMVLGSGMSGLLHVKLAKTKQCRVIATDINPKKLAFAGNMGADTTLDAAENTAAPVVAENNHRADVVFLCTSAMPAIDQAWNWVNKGGVIVFFAVPHPDKKVTIPINHFWTREIRIITSYYCGPPDIEAAINLIETQAIEVDDLITRQIPLQDIADGFRMVMEGQETLKVIIKPQH
ncbi:MAG: alcohol dehydrogenase catalytic domain-containing protein [Deltaproteobacteria bacterium]|nr:alcohol dehydrogenase catalytic domain-containing protein [Deltaproteobacteria bacterium]